MPTWHTGCAILARFPGGGGRPGNREHSRPTAGRQGLPGAIKWNRKFWISSTANDSAPRGGLAGGHGNASQELTSAEVFNALGNTLAVSTVPDSALEPLREDEILCTRMLAAA